MFCVTNSEAIYRGSWYRVDMRWHWLVEVIKLRLNNVKVLKVCQVRSKSGLYLK